MITLGVILLILGSIGIALPVLPTTPFVLLASVCFAYSSPRLYDWLAQTKYFGEFIVNYKTKAGINKGIKIRALAFLFLTIGISFYFAANWHVRVLLIIIAAAVSIHILLIKTKR